MNKPSYEVRVVGNREEDFSDIVRSGSMISLTRDAYIVEPCIRLRVNDQGVRDEVFETAVSLAKKLKNYDVSIIIKKR